MRRIPLALTLAVVALAACGDGRQPPESSRVPSASSTIPPAQPATTPRDLASCEYRTSATIRPRWETGQPPRLNVEGYACADAAVIRVERRAGAAADGAPRWEWVADITAEPLAPDEVFVLLYCNTRGKYDTRIVAIARRRETRALTDIRAAWLADTAAPTLRPLPPEEVACDNEDYGV